MPQIASVTAIDYCARQVQSGDRDRFLLTMALPPATRPALLTILAFHLEIARTREVVSEPLLGRIRLQWWREALEELRAGTTRKHEVIEALAEVQAQDQVRLDFDHLQALIDARETDLEPLPPASLGEFDAYAVATGGALADCLARCLGLSDRHIALSAKIGALHAQLGLLRAIPFRARNNRVDLPLEVLGQHGTTARAVRDLAASPALAAVVRTLADRAIAQLDELGRGADRPRRGLPALLAVLAREQYRRLKAGGFDPLNPAVTQRSALLPLRLWWRQG